MKESKNTFENVVWWTYRVSDSIPLWSGGFDIEHSQEKKKCFPPLAGAGEVGATYPTDVNSLISHLCMLL